MKGGLALPGDEPSRLSALPRWIDAIGVPADTLLRISTCIHLFSQVDWRNANDING
jgi:hypothetical protein